MRNLKEKISDSGIHFFPINSNTLDSTHNFVRLKMTQLPDWRFPFKEVRVLWIFVRVGRMFKSV